MREVLRSPAILALFSVAACARPAPTLWERLGIPFVDGKPDLSRVEIRMERGECEGTCPSYEVILRGDGEGRWIGKAYVRFMGEEPVSFALERVPALLEQLERVCIASGTHVCSWGKTSDVPLANITLKIGDRAYEQSDPFGGDPQHWIAKHAPDTADPEHQWHALAAEVERQIDEIAGSQGRIGTLEERKGNRPPLPPSK
jgi:hypothetical protein